MKEYRFTILLILIVILAVFLRFYQLGSVPSGLTNDEVNFGYDAYSILKTEHDQWGNSLPITGFKGFGAYNPVLYVYLLVPSIVIFGLTPIGIRFPSAFFGTLSVFTIYFLAKRLFGEKIGLASAFLLAVSPWAMGLSRVGIDSNAAMFFLLLGFTALTAIKKSKN